VCTADIHVRNSNDAKEEGDSTMKSISSFFVDGNFVMG
jgi:hypothetical protein